MILPQSTGRLCPKCRSRSMSERRCSSTAWTLACRRPCRRPRCTPSSRTRRGFPIVRSRRMSTRRCSCSRPYRVCRCPCTRRLRTQPHCTRHRPAKRPRRHRSAGPDRCIACRRWCTRRRKHPRCSSSCTKLRLPTSLCRRTSAGLARCIVSYSVRRPLRTRLGRNLAPDTALLDSTAHSDCTSRRRFLGKRSPRASRHPCKRRPYTPDSCTRRRPARSRSNRKSGRPARCTAWPTACTFLSTLRRCTDSCRSFRPPTAPRCCMSRA